MKRMCPECQVVYDDLRYYILCPHGRREPARCHFCSEPPAASCRWPDERFITARYAELKPGDLVRRAIERLKDRPPATVAHIAPWFLAAGDKIPAGVQVLLRIRGKEKEIQVRGSSPVMVMRPLPCDLPACELHLRRVGDDVAYCANHWRAWEMIV